jgi:N-acyl-D-aspartate/D-glutamate deacylase
MDTAPRAVALRALMLALAAFAASPRPAVAQQAFDIVLKGGRVIDPETGLDAVRDVAIRGDSIARVSAQPLRGRRTIDANGLVVTPGFIELHQHGFDKDSYRLLALDGVTTALELEIGVPDIERFTKAHSGQALIHFGASASLLPARLKAWDLPVPESLLGPEAAVVPKSGPATNDAATTEQLERVLARLQREVGAGALGIGIGLEYAPGTTRHELIEVFRLAKSLDVPVFVHARSSGLKEPGSGIEAVTELVGAAAITGAALHVVHVNSVCMKDAMECVAMLAGARERGLDVTTEAYPYTVAMTLINSAYFNPGWREKRGLDYGDIELPESGERLTKETFDELHSATEGRFVLIHVNPDSVVGAVMAAPSVIVASDGVLLHPRGAGTRARVLSRYVRDQRSLGLADAIRKMSLMPAQRLERLTPEAKRLGRIQEGARADVVIFDPATVQDRATFRAPAEASAGMRYVLVAGTPVVDQGKIVEGVAPGQALVRVVTSSASEAAQHMNQFAERYTAAWCSQDPARVAHFFAESATLTINGGAPNAGRAGITEAARSFMTAFPDMVVEMDGLDRQGQGYIYRWTLIGTNTGPGGTGRKVRISGYEEWTIGADGLIAKSLGHYDEADWDRQLGRAEPPNP